MTVGWESDCDKEKPKHSEEKLSEFHSVPSAFKNDTTKSGMGSNRRLVLTDRPLTLD
jgi:hypothetical protein